MTREELNKSLELSNEVKNSDKFSEDIKLRNYVELRIIADALVDISQSLKTDILDINYSNGKYTARLANIIFSIKEKYTNKL